MDLVGGEFEDKDASVASVLQAGHTRDDWVVQAGENVGFAFKSGESIRGLGEGLRHDLEAMARSSVMFLAR